MRRRAWVTGVCCALALASCAVCAENRIENSWGTLSIDWTPDGFVSIDVLLLDSSPLPQVGTTGTWVLTGHAHRFADDLYAWQIHVSRQFDSFMIIPNDFLASSAFAFAEVGITSHPEAMPAGLHVEIPGTMFGRSLVTGGDTVDVHAIWIQLEPLWSITIPEQDVAGAASDDPVGGGAVVESSDVEEPEDGTDALPDETEPGTDWFPAQRTYVRGEAIEHRFVLVDPETEEAAQWATGTINVMRTHEQGPSQIVLFEMLIGNPTTGVFSYRIDTSAFVAGVYELIVWTSVEPNGRSTTIQVEAPPL